MKIQYLSWDSSFFKLKVGKINITSSAFFNSKEFKEKAVEENYDLIYIFNYGNMLNQQDLIIAQIELVDIMLTMSKKFNGNKHKKINYEFKTNLSQQEINDCYFIAEQTSSVSRFYQEKTIGKEKTKELYRKWIDNALVGTHSDGLFMFKDNDTVAGIHLVKTDDIDKIGYFTMTGVSPDFKRRGIGRNLWLQSFNYWATDKDIELIKSPFSFQNKDSLNFHLKMGFNKVEEIKYIYHYRK